MKRIAILASGRGSNAENIWRTIQSSSLSLKIVAVVSDQEDALVLQKAKEANIPSFFVMKEKMNKHEHEEKIIRLLKELDAEWVFLAGYMRILSSYFLDQFMDAVLNLPRVINIHPSLLPCFKGVNAYMQAYEYGVQVYGATLHIVDEKTDHGSIISQRAFRVESEMTLEMIQKKGIENEHFLFKEFLIQFSKKNLIKHEIKERTYLRFY